MDPEGFFGGPAAGGSSLPEKVNRQTSSAVRIGLKRELAFALKSQAELSEFLGRTRLRKPPPSPFPSPDPPVSTPAMKKRGRKKLSDYIPPDVRLLNTNAMPGVGNSTEGAQVRAPQVIAMSGFSASSPIVVDDADVLWRATKNVSVERKAGPIPITLNSRDLIGPSWLEQQVSRITQAGNKYVVQEMEAGGFDVSGGRAANISFSNANRSARLNSPESVLDSIESTSRDTPHRRTSGKITRKDVGLHKLVFMEDVLPEGTMLQYVVNGRTNLVGYAKDCGIFCTCCSEVISPSQFEAHAGQAQRRKPYNYIYTSNGVSLHELSVTLSKHRKLLDSENDDLCSICEDAGELVLCDLCPRAFHQACAGLSSVPEGDWHCRFCQSMHQRENYVAYNDNARAAGRIPGVDAIDQILKRCILIAKLPDSRVGGCSLCRSKDYTKSGFDQRTVLLCDQCEKEYHVACLKNHGMDDLKEKPEGDWFCCAECITIHNALEDVINHGALPLPVQVLDIINRNNHKKNSSKDTDAASGAILGHGGQALPNQDLYDIARNNSSESSVKDAGVNLGDVSSHGAQRFPNEILNVIEQETIKKNSINHANGDLKWRLFKGKTASDSDKLFLSSAVTVLHESFDPIISGKKGADLVTQMVFGRAWGQMDLQGMYCTILTVNSLVVSVSVFRILGSQAAELPLVATRKDCRGKGYFGALFACIGRLLFSLNVKHLVLPATDEAKTLWTNKYGFSMISLDQLYKLAPGIKIVDFEGTTLLHKTVSDLILPGLGSHGI